MDVQLLGQPSVRVDGVPVDGPRGNKTWALLAYLVGVGVPVPRDRLVGLLFPDADDGLAALRWNLTQLRRAVRSPQSFRGDPVAVALGPDVRVDVHLLATAPWYEVVDRVDVGAPLLEGVTFPACPGFELWLEGERRHVVELASSALREAARALLTAGRPDDAAPHARRLVDLQPWDENAHELLVRALAAGGDVAAARRHVALVTELFLEELGAPPARSLAAAAEPVLARPSGASRTRTTAQLQAGASAMAAGAPEAGIESLRRAVAGARELREPELLVRALTELGSAEVHAVRGSDESGASALREAVAVAERSGRPELATTACRELGYVEFLRCRFEAAERWLDRAAVTVGADESERAWILALRGSVRSDAGRHDEALVLLRDAVRHAEMAGDGRAATFALTHLGRLHVLRHEDDAAVECLERADRLTETSGWLSFCPYPRSWLAEVALRRGRVTEADELLVSAHTLALEVGDPCWESLAARGLGLVAAVRGDDDTAARLLHDAPAACHRWTDAYLWLEAYGLVAQAGHALEHGLPRALELIEELDRIASAHGMRELQAEAALLRLAAGRPGALDAARSAVAAVDNPVLAARLAAAEKGLRGARTAAG
nr:BTAD domain-containing putative transcriptional regulator [Petropleomorpha daqingensis]